MSDRPANLDVVDLADHVIIAGFGIPGRAIAESLRSLRVAFCVIERNADVVHRCSRTMTIIEGDVRSEETLLRARIDRARLLAVAMPDESMVVHAVEVARRINPDIPIIARCSYTSTGLEAAKKGATDVIVSEQVVARELGRMVESRLGKRINPVTDP